MKHRPLTIGSVFSGIGGFDLAGEWMGWKTEWMVENNLFCRRILRQHFPQANLYRDMRKVDFSKLKWVDIICGGFPCQPHSSINANVRRTAHETEDFLWTYFANAIRMVGPTYVVVENVPNIIRDGTLGIILKDLAACGYDAEWDTVSAHHVGALHRRERTWIVAYPRGFGMERPRPRKHARKTEKGWKNRARPLHEFSQTPFASRDGVPQPLLRRVAHGFPAQMDQIKAIGNAVVPQVVMNFPFRVINRMERRQERIRIRQERHDRRHSWDQWQREIARRAGAAQEEG